MSPTGRPTRRAQILSIVPAAVRTLVLDSQAVAALAHRTAGMAERLEAARRMDARVVIPSVVLAEVMTGGADDAAVWHVVRRFPVVDLDARWCARAGGLRERAEKVRRKKRDLTIDALVAAVATGVQPAVVITADPDDFALLLDGYDVKISTVNQTPH
ncbi:MAG: type II toxin-antitoxin system VapC family toxin [Micrococcales bacterium]|nr:type II toxin-antitoxin system VapC family toxin [Micrococcales bacterium]